MSNVPTNLIPTKITGLPEYLGSSTLGYFPYVLEGRTYKVQFGQLAAVGAVPSTRVIAAGTGLTGGGDLSQDRVISIANGGVGTAQLADSGVIAGSYGSGTDVPVLTVDAKGRITAASTTPLSISGYVPTSRTITTGAGLLGGGSLASNLTLTVDFSSATPQALGSATAGVSTAAARGDHVHPAVDLSDTDQTQGALPLGRGGTGDALSPVAGAVVYSTGTKLALADPGIPGQVLTSDGAGEPYWQTIAGTGTVTSVSVVTANGFAGTVANANTIPAITVSTTVTGLVKGNGTALSAAVAGTDYVAPGVITGSGLTMATSRLLGRTTASSGAVEEITVGTGLSLSGGSLVNSAPDQVVTLTGGTAISISGTYPSFTITNTAPDQIVSLTGAGTTVVTGTYPNFTITSNDQYTGTVTSVAASGGTTGLSFTGSPITTSGTLTLGGTLVVANGGTGATTAAGARTNLGAAASGANSDITGLSGITGAISSPLYIQFDSGAGTALAAGRMWYDQLTGAFNLGMGNGNITQQVGEELFVYGKASAAINDSPLKIVYQTGTVGGSGTITFGPTVAGITNGDLIIGVATESLALNQFGRVTSYGIVRGITTDGSAYGETWADGDTIWYNPVTGNPTNIKPSAPNIKVSVGVLIKAGNGGSGSIQVEINHGSVLGGTDSNVQITSVANNDLLQYSSSLGYWRNIAASSVSVGSATNLAGGAANRIAYQTGSGTTGFITAPSVANTFLEWSGSAFQWSANPLGTVTSVAASGGTTGLTFSGSPITTSGTLTLGGTLNVANGGTGATSLTSGYLVKGNGTSAVSASVVYDDGTNVGIGTSSPLSKATISQSGTVKLSLESQGSWNAGVGADASGNLLFYNPLATERMRINTGGGVVIGGTATYAGLTINNPDNTKPVFYFTSNTNGSYPTALATTGSIDNNFSGGAGEVSFWNNQTTAVTAFVFRQQTGASARTDIMTLLSSGDVGIGDTAPAYKLTVAGDMRLTGGGDIRLSSATGTTTAGGDSMIYNDANNMIFTTGTTTAERMRISSGGDVGIGTTAPQGKMEIRTASGGTVTNALTLSNYVGSTVNTGVALYFDPNGAGSVARAASIQSVQPTSGNFADLRFFTSNSDTPAERVRVTPAGNVGIGTTNPTSLLDVNGNAEVNGTLFLGSSNHGNLASDSNTLYPRGDNIAFQNAAGSGTYAYINSSGDFGIGTTSLSNRFTVKGGTTWLQNFAGSASSPTETVDWPVPALNVTSYGDFTLQTMMTFTLPNDGNYFTGDSVWNFRLDQTASSTTSSGVNGMRFMGPGYLMFGPGTTEKARITSSGNWLVGTTSLAAGNWANEIKNTTTDAWPLALNATTRGMVVRNSSASSGYYAYFEYNGGTNNGSISWSGGTTSYNTTSDARIKDNIVDAPEAGDLIDDIKVRSWDFKADGAHWRYGMVAQELIEVAPEAVSVPEDPDMMMGVDYAKLVPMLIKEVQSLRARVAQLEGK